MQLTEITCIRMRREEERIDWVRCVSATWRGRQASKEGRREMTRCNSITQNNSNIRFSHCFDSLSWHHFFRYFTIFTSTATTIADTGDQAAVFPLQNSGQFTDLGRNKNPAPILSSSSFGILDSIFIPCFETRLHLIYASNWLFFILDIYTEPLPDKLFTFPLLFCC